MSDQNDDNVPGPPPEPVPLTAPVISITVHGGSRVRVDAAITKADGGSRATAPLPTANPPIWHRTSVLWSAVAALAAVAAVVLGWAASR
ncbi:hypothetical protein [Streptomyces sp. NBC_00648]|uniref:hypothetical protein n=1 Tax=Streptomyces sp. NBC_00648 TaxID=2975797 RepID=UPI003253EBFE